MITRHDGSVINNVIAMDESKSYKDFIAFQDEDGAVFHIRKTELRKLYFYMLNNSPIPKNSNLIDDIDISKLTPKELDKFILEKAEGNVFMR